eukprot:scaffold210298_cov28-Tisochrysis_lutea.AAC.3
MQRHAHGCHVVRFWSVALYLILIERSSEQRLGGRHGKVLPPLQDVLGKGGAVLGAPKCALARAAHGCCGEQGRAPNTNGCFDPRSHPGVSDGINQLAEAYGGGAPERGHGSMQVSQRSFLSARHSICARCAAAQIRSKECVLVGSAQPPSQRTVRSRLEPSSRWCSRWHHRPPSATAPPGIPTVPRLPTAHQRLPQAEWLLCCSPSSRHRASCPSRRLPRPERWRTHAPASEAGVSRIQLPGGGAQLDSLVVEQGSLLRHGLTIAHRAPPAIELEDARHLVDPSKSSPYCCARPQPEAADS